jgi:hypothetical protein
LGTSLKDWMNLILTNGSVALRYYPRVFLVNIVSALGIPFRVYERWKFDEKIKATQISKPPIFILGHWRSGTTHLHNVLCQDNQFGFITMMQAAFPKSFMTNNIFRHLVDKILPKTRPMDNMAMGTNNPQEEEMALGNLFPYSFYNGFYFPQRTMEYFFKYIRFKNISLRVLEQWKRVYYYLIKKATLNMEGKQMVLKNPANTARIKLLLDLFPNAKFIHLYRNPYTVYASMRNFYKETIEGFMLQKVPNKEIENNIFELYKHVMASYFKEKTLIPNGNLIELKFEDFEKDAINELDLLYSELKLAGFENAKQNFLSYMHSLRNYKKNEYALTEDTINAVRRKWHFTIKKWDYSLPLEYQTV